MTGATSERALTRFVKNNEKDLITVLAIKRNQVPSRSVIAKIMQNVDFTVLSNVFTQWMKNSTDTSKKTWISIDGKALAGTVQTSPRQRFTSLVSVYASTNKHVLAMQSLQNSKKSEIPIVQQLIKSLDLQNVVFTLDALHCQKETLKTIVESGNDYVVGLKRNQKNLYKQAKKTLNT